MHLREYHWLVQKWSQPLTEPKQLKRYEQDLFFLKLIILLIDIQMPLHLPWVLQPTPTLLCLRSAPTPFPGQQVSTGLGASSPTGAGQGCQSSATMPACVCSLVDGSLDSRLVNTVGLPMGLPCPSVPSILLLTLVQRLAVSICICLG